MEDYCISWNHRGGSRTDLFVIKTSIYGNFVFALEDEKSGGGLGSISLASSLGIGSRWWWWKRFY
jgi:hypothetical protein